jgi:hypothetical protein
MGVFDVTFDDVTCFIEFSVALSTGGRGTLPASAVVQILTLGLVDTLSALDLVQCFNIPGGIVLL